jgi:hypothetical protein
MRRILPIRQDCLVHNVARTIVTNVSIDPREEEGRELSEASCARAPKSKSVFHTFTVLRRSHAATRKVTHVPPSAPDFNENSAPCVVWGG